MDDDGVWTVGDEMIDIERIEEGAERHRRAVAEAITRVLRRGDASQASPDRPAIRFHHPTGFAQAVLAERGSARRVTERRVGRSGEAP